MRTILLGAFAALLGIGCSGDRVARAQRGLARVVDRQVITSRLMAELDARAVTETENQQAPPRQTPAQIALDDVPPAEEALPEDLLPRDLPEETIIAGEESAFGPVEEAPEDVIPEEEAPEEPAPAVAEADREAPAPGERVAGAPGTSDAYAAGQTAFVPESSDAYPAGRTAFLPEANDAYAFGQGTAENVEQPAIGLLPFPIFYTPALLQSLSASPAAVASRSGLGIVPWGPPTPPAGPSPGALGVPAPGLAAPATGLVAGSPFGSPYGALALPVQPSLFGNPFAGARAP